MAGEPAIPEAAAEGPNNCEWAAQGLIDSVAAQPDSPHQMPGLIEEGIARPGQCNAASTDQLSRVMLNCHSMGEAR